MSVNRAPGW